MIAWRARKLDEKIAVVWKTKLDIFLSAKLNRFNIIQ